MNNYSSSKSFRMLNIYERLVKGELVRKKNLAQEFSVSEKSIQRDMNDLRNYFADSFEQGRRKIIYDRTSNSYRLVGEGNSHLRNDEILAICKILLESRALCKSEVEKIINKLIVNTTNNERDRLNSIIQNELFHYVPLKHEKKLLNMLWKLSDFIYSCDEISIEYSRMDGSNSKRRVQPLAIMFSEFYFYLIGNIADFNNDFPTIFRVDRINSVEKTGMKFKIPYKDRFEEGEFRKRVQFMYSGELKRVVFEFTGPSLEAVLDRLPTAKVIESTNEGHIISTEVYGDGIYMWIATQGDNIRILEGSR